MMSSSEHPFVLLHMTDKVDILVSQWIRHRVRSGLIKPRTGRYQRGELDYFVTAHGTNLTMRADRKVFARWLEAIGHLSPNSRRVHVSTVRSFVRWASAEGHLPARALTLIPQVHGARAVPRALNGDHASQLIRSLDTQKQRVVVGTMIWSGLRCAEVAGLKVEDVNEREATLFIVGKGGHERMVPIPPELAPIITAWLDLRRRVPGPLIPSRFGGHYHPNTISNLVSRWMRTSGVKVASRDGRSAHALRHTCASDVLDRGAPITVVQQLLGHQHLSTTSIYLRRSRLEDLHIAMQGRDYQ